MLCGDFDAYPFLGEGTVDENDPAVAAACERVAARNHAFGRELHLTSQSSSCETRGMQALRVHELGEPESVLRLEDVPVPEPRTR